MKKLKKTVISTILLLVLALTLPTSASAHSGNSGVKYYPQVTKWDIYENSKHWKSYNTSLTVNSGDFTGYEFATYVTNAVNSWNSKTFNNQSIIQMTESSSGVVKFISKSSTDFAAVFGSTNGWGGVYRSNATADSDNHYNLTAGNVEIWINWNEVLSQKPYSSRVNCCNHTTQHELGHVLGLKDIPASAAYTGHIMCNEFGSNYPVPTTISSNDVQGAAVILGRHKNTDHSFTNMYIFHNQTYHRNPCSLCGGYKLTTHTYVNGTCTACGYHP